MRNSASARPLQTNRGCVLLLIAVLVLPACGGGAGSPTSLPTSGTAAGSRLIAQGTFQITGLPLSPPFLPNLSSTPFSTSASGGLEVVVDWTDAANPLVVAVMRGGCTFQQFYNQQCAPVSSVTALVKPLRHTVPNLPPGAYSLVIVNPSLNTESGVYQVFLAS